MEKKRRSSILKVQKIKNSTNDVDQGNEEDDTAVITARRVSFASSTQIKPFLADPEKNTIWDSTYEESMQAPDNSPLSLELQQNSKSCVTTKESTEIVTNLNVTTINNFDEDEVDIMPTVDCAMSVNVEENISHLTERSFNKAIDLRDCQTIIQDKTIDLAEIIANKENVNPKTSELNFTKNDNNCKETIQDMGEMMSIDDSYMMNISEDMDLTVPVDQNLNRTRKEIDSSMEFTKPVNFFDVFKKCENKENINFVKDFTKHVNPTILKKHIIGVESKGYVSKYGFSEKSQCVKEGFGMEFTKNVTFDIQQTSQKEDVEMDFTIPIISAQNHSIKKPSMEKRKGIEQPDMGFTKPVTFNIQQTLQKEDLEMDFTRPINSGHNHTLKKPFMEQTNGIEHPDMELTKPVTFNMQQILQKEDVEIDFTGPINSAQNHTLKKSFIEKRKGVEQPDMEFTKPVTFNIQQTLQKEDLEMDFTRPINSGHNHTLKKPLMEQTNGIEQPDMELTKPVTFNMQQNLQKEDVEIDFTGLIHSAQNHTLKKSFIEKRKCVEQPDMEFTKPVTFNNQQTLQKEDLEMDFTGPISSGHNRTLKKPFMEQTNGIEQPHMELTTPVTFNMQYSTRSVQEEFAMKVTTPDSLHVPQVCQQGIQIAMDVAQPVNSSTLKTKSFASRLKETEAEPILECTEVVSFKILQGIQDDNSIDVNFTRPANPSDLKTKILACTLVSADKSMEAREELLKKTQTSASHNLPHNLREVNDGMKLPKSITCNLHQTVSKEHNIEIDLIETVAVSDDVESQNMTELEVPFKSHAAVNINNSETPKKRSFDLPVQIKDIANSLSKAVLSDSNVNNLSTSKTTSAHQNIANVNKTKSGKKRPSQKPLTPQIFAIKKGRSGANLSHEQIEKSKINNCQHKELETETKITTDKNSSQNEIELIDRNKSIMGENSKNEFSMRFMTSTPYDSQLSLYLDNTSNLINCSVSGKRRPESDVSKVAAGVLNPSFSKLKCMPLGEFNSNSFHVSLSHLQSKKENTASELDTVASDNQLPKTTESQGYAILVDNINTAPEGTTATNSSAAISEECRVSDVDTRRKTFIVETENIKQEETERLYFERIQAASTDNEDVDLLDDTRPPEMLFDTLNSTNSSNSMSELNNLGLPGGSFKYTLLTNLKVDPRSLGSMYDLIEVPESFKELFNTNLDEVVPRNDNHKESLFRELLKIIDKKRDEIEALQLQLDNVKEESRCSSSSCGCEDISNMQESIEIDDIFEEPKVETVEEKILKLGKSCKKYWKLCSSTHNTYEFSTLFRTLIFTAYLDDDCSQKCSAVNAVKNVEVQGRIKSDSNPQGLYIHQLFYKRLTMKAIHSALGEKFDILSLLDYVQITMQKLLDLLPEFDKLTKDYGTMLESDLKLHFSIINIDLAIVWKFQIDILELDNLNEKTLTFHATVGEIREIDVKRCMDNCPTGFPFIRKFLSNLYSVVDRMEKKLKK